MWSIARPRRVRSLVCTLALVVVATVAAISGEPPDSGSDPVLASTTASTVDSQLVSLITGDRVRLDTFSDGRQAATVYPAPREHGQPGHHTIADGGQLYVIPFDAAPLIPGHLDRELFNVTKLAEYGYHQGTPVIATGRPGAARALREQAGLTVSATLPSIDAIAGTVTPGGAWWRSVTASAGTAGLASAEPAKIWLDERVEVALAESVPMVGAPTAWDAGYDGTGTTVAVLDTGVDAEHPDLAEAVVGEANFTGSDTARDRHGHGTHVAGTIAGSGAASGGTYVGVAPGARILNGKVLGDDGFGNHSWVIAGMEWAAEQGADVINMSLGSPPTDGTDPVSQAVNRLTDSHGVLFVIAAGNRGSANHTIDAPGAAEAALTVGSVNKSEVLAFGSGRGPRLGDFAIKPDMTGPGVLITSARAEGSTIGTPVGDDYQTLSGTSMATPHVAGAAAILHQADPELGPAELKATLMTTAVPNDTNDVYQQGGGRLDIPAALASPVLVAPPSLSLGYFRYPQDDATPVSAEVSYTNRTDQPLTLDLDLVVASRDGAVPSDAMLSVSPDTITVEPDETGVATVTVDVSAGEHGLYGGYLVAEQDGEVVTRTPVGFYHEPEHYDLTVTGIARDGQPAAAPSSFDVMNAADRSVFSQGTVGFADGRGTVRVPPGTYAVMGVVFTGPEGETRDWTLVGEPEVEVTGDTTVVLDARAGLPITVDTPAHESVPVDTWTLDYRRFAVTGGSLSHRYTMPVSAFPNGMYAEPTGPVSLGRLEFAARTRLGAPGPASPYLYDLVHYEPEGVPADLHYVADPAQLASVHNQFYSDLPGQTGAEIRHFWTPGLAISSADVVPLPLGSERVEYLVPGVLRYQQSIYQQHDGEQGRMFEPITEYAAGEQREQPWWGGPRRAGLREGGPFDISVPATRRDDTFRFPLMDWVDTGTGHYSPGGDAPDSTAFRLYRDGELVNDVRPPATGVAVPPEPATYRVEFEAARDAPWWATSVRTSTIWTFDSAQTEPGGTEVLPLILFDVEAGLDLHNTMPLPRDDRGQPAIEVLARHQAGAPAIPITGVRVWLSYDDGASWHARPMRDLGGGRVQVIAGRPDRAGTGFASLRMEAWDADGNRGELTVIRAWRLPPR
ncbi:MAG TPA: S8 family serine peptidase [Natronosporangium sp.]